MKYNQVIFESLQKVALKKVRIKIDPINVSANTNLANCNGYEGYVLAEDQEITKVLVITPDQDNNLSVMDIPNEHLVKYTNINENLTKLKEFIILALDLSVDDPLIQQLHAAESIDDVEVFLKDRGLADNEIADLYKYYIANE
jgi:hypothetical protein